VVFFESENDMIQNDQIGAAQVSAVAATAGASANVKYAEGVMVLRCRRWAYEHQWADNSLSLLNYKALLLLVGFL
jgi:hypothetical protein